MHQEINSANDRGLSDRLEKDFGLDLPIEGFGCEAPQLLFDLAAQTANLVVEFDGLIHLIGDGHGVHDLHPRVVSNFGYGLSILRIRHDHEQGIVNNIQRHDPMFASQFCRDESQSSGLDLVPFQVDERYI